MAGKDKLTGLLSRSDFDTQFRDALIQAGETQTTLTLALIDLDWFKKVNDGYGHETGDVVLKTISSIVRENSPDQTLLFRFGGEEFALLFPDAEREQAFLVVEQIRSKMERAARYTVDGETIDLKVTVSGGVAAYPTDGVTTTEVLRKTDQALYRAKTTGRNKVCIAQEERMATKTTHYTLTQLERLTRLSEEEKVGEAVLLREALDDLLHKYRVSSVES